MFTKRLCAYAADYVWFMRVCCVCPVPSQLTDRRRSADAALVTSLRDGMNLVSLEYIACQEEKHGVLILSEFAGVRAPFPIN